MQCRSCYRLLVLRLWDCKPEMEIKWLYVGMIDWANAWMNRWFIDAKMLCKAPKKHLFSKVLTPFMEMYFTSPDASSAWMSRRGGILCWRLCSCFGVAEQPPAAKIVVFGYPPSNSAIINLPEMWTPVIQSQIAADTLTAYLSAPTTTLSHFCSSQLLLKVTAPSSLFIKRQSARNDMQCIFIIYTEYK